MDSPYMKSVNEIGRLVVNFASLIGNEDHYPLGPESQIWLVCEITPEETSPQWRAISGIQWEYSFFSSICYKEVIEAEFGERLVNGKALKAEQYIAEWRQALVKPVQIPDLQSYGLLLAGVVQQSLSGIQLLASQGDASVTGVLESEFHLDTTGDAVSWNVPLVNLANCKYHERLKSIYIRDGETSTKSSRLLRVENVDGGQVLRAALQGASVSFDLFADEGVCA